MADLDAETLTGGNDLERLRADASGPAAVVVDWGAATSRGTVRPENEDAFGHVGDKLFVIADGMGGHPGGRLAATTAVQGVLSTATSTGVTSMRDLVRRVADQVRLATRARGFEVAGTTLVIVRVIDGVVTLATVGDSRVYRLRDGLLIQLTNDHTVRTELAASGVDPRQLPAAGLHALTRYVGAADGNDVPDVTSLVPKVGDQLLLATDGVFKQLDDRAMIDAMSDPRGITTANAAAAALVAVADRSGGRDNATAIVLHFGKEASA